jgi:hypothetical protein
MATMLARARRAMTVKLVYLADETGLTDLATGAAFAADAGLATGGGASTAFTATGGATSTGAGAISTGAATASIGTGAASATSAMVSIGADAT